MNADEFYAKLAEATERLDLDWCLCPTFSKKTVHLCSLLRAGHSEGDEEPVAMCPITAVCYAETGYHLWDKEAYLAAEKIGLSNRLSSRIINAADGFMGGTRNKLMDAVGVSAEGGC